MLEAYVGQPVHQVMIERGAPDMVIDLPDGRRAFQWAVTTEHVTPRLTTGQANIYAPPGAFGSVNYNQMTVGGNTVTDTCRYTLYGRFDPASRSWIVESFEKPSFMCL
jgi:hypothetical protein